MADDIEDVEEILRRQDEAMALLERLRIAEPLATQKGVDGPDGRRDFRRWPTPDGVAVELHDGERWQATDCTDLGIGGGRVRQLPAWVEGPAPARLKAPTGPGVLVLADVMWRDRKTDTAGLRFEFLDNEERDLWAEQLIDALLARYSLG